MEISERVNYIYAGFHDPIQKITGDTYQALCSRKYENFTIPKYRKKQSKKGAEICAKIEKCIAENPGIRAYRVAEKLGMKKPTVRSYIDWLYSQGRIYNKNLKIYLTKGVDYDE